MTKTAQRVARDNTGFDDRLGRTLQRTGVVVVLVPDVVVVAVVTAVSKNPALAVKVAAASTVIGLGMVAAGKYLQSRD